MSELNSDASQNLFSFTYVILSLLGAVVMVLTFVRSTAPKRKLEEDEGEIPSSKRNWFFGNTFEVASMGPHAFVTREFARHNFPIVEMEISRTRTVTLFGGELISQVIKNERCLQGFWIGSFLQLLGERSIMGVNGIEHKAQRAVVLSFLDNEILRGHTTRIAEKFNCLLDECIECGTRGEFVEFYERINSVAFNVNGRLFFGESFPPSSLQRVMKLFPTWTDGFAAVPINLPFTRYGKAVRALAQIRDIFVEEIERREREGVPSRKDLLQAVFETVNPRTNQRYTKEDFRQQIATLSFGALETTVSAEWFLVSLLSKFPDMLTPVREEIIAYTGGEGFQRAEGPLGLSYDDLMFNLPTIRAAGLEVLRFSCPVHMTPRKCVEDFWLTHEGRRYRVNKGDYVWIAIGKTTFSCPSIRQPEKFDLTRFLPPRNEHEKIVNGLPIFGWGGRLCPGMKFANIQIYTLIALLAMKDVKVELREEPIVVMTAAKKCKNGFWVKMTRESREKNE